VGTAGPEQREQFCSGLYPSHLKVCTGAFLSEQLWNQAQANPSGCLQEHVPVFKAKMCQMCSFDFADGVVSPDYDRNGTFCDKRFKMLKHVSGFMEQRDTGFLDVVHKMNRQFDAWTHKYGSYPEMLQKGEDWQSSMDSETVSKVDMDSDGKVSLEEFRAFLNVLVLMGDMMPAPMNGKDYIHNYPEFASWGGKVNDDKFDWMGYFQVP